MANFSAQALEIPDVILVSPRMFKDNRGYFMETYVERAYAELGISARFVQDNQSYSARTGTIRGLHFQAPPHAQAKLVRVTRGAVFDVAVDLRRASPTFGRWCGAELSAENGMQLFIPRGFAHAFCTLVADVEVVYKVDDFYSPQTEGGVRWDDPDLAVQWRLPATDVIVSEKDALLPHLRAFSSPF